MTGETSRVRYDAVIATLIGALAVGVSAYTAWIQRQQVRAQVWPILEYSSGNEPELHLSLSNKGVGPALIRHVIVTVDGAPAAGWKDVLNRLLGEGHYAYAEEDIGHRVFSANEALNILSPRFDGGTQGTLGKRFDKERFRVGIEICYCSTLGDCWTLSAPGRQRASTSETARCPEPSATTFKE